MPKPSRERVPAELSSCLQTMRANKCCKCCKVTMDHYTKQNDYNLNVN